MRIEIYPNFATQEEIKVLNAWAELGVINKWLDKGFSEYGLHTDKRLTSRQYAGRYHIPDEIITISNRVRNFVGINTYPIIDLNGKNGVVVNYILPDGYVYKHKDAHSFDGLATLRCNILTQKADTGGVLYVEGQQVDVEVGDLHCYLVSEHEHWVTTVGGNTPRIMWMFGAHMPAEDWNFGKIGLKQ